MARHRPGRHRPEVTGGEEGPRVDAVDTPGRPPRPRCRLDGHGAGVVETRCNPPDHRECHQRSNQGDSRPTGGRSGDESAPFRPPLLPRPPGRAWPQTRGPSPAQSTDSLAAPPHRPERQADPSSLEHTVQPRAKRDGALDIAAEATNPDPPSARPRANPRRLRGPAAPPRPD